MEEDYGNSTNKRTLVMKTDNCWGHASFEINVGQTDKQTDTHTQSSHRTENQKYADNN